MSEPVTSQVAIPDLHTSDNTSNDEQATTNSGPQPGHNAENFQFNLLPPVLMSEIFIPQILLSNVNDCLEPMAYGRKFISIMQVVKIFGRTVNHEMLRL